MQESRGDGIKYGHYRFCAAGLGCDQHPLGTARALFLILWPLRVRFRCGLLNFGVQLGAQDKQVAEIHIQVIKPMAAPREPYVVL